MERLPSARSVLMHLSYRWRRQRSSGGGGDSQQMVTVADAGRMLAPLVAQEVEKETKKIEIRMQVSHLFLWGGG